MNHEPARRFAHHDAARWDEDFPFRGRAAVHQAIQQVGRPIADGGAVKTDARQRGRGERAQCLFVLATDDRRFLRHRDARALAGVKQAHAELVVGREDADGFFQAREPLAEPRLALLPIGRAVGFLLRQIRAVKAGGLERADEILHPLDEKLLGVQAVNRKLPVATLQKMLRHHSPDRAVVHPDERQVAAQITGA